MRGPFLGLSYMVAYVACYGIQNEPSMTKANFDGIGIAERQEEGCLDNDGNACDGCLATNGNCNRFKKRRCIKKGGTWCGCTVNGVEGDGTAQGTCDAGFLCKADGKCGCLVSGAAGDGTAQGTCATSTDLCTAEGTCLACENQVPSICSLPSSQDTCEELGSNLLICEDKWKSSGHCGTTYEDYVKDTCQITCGTCNDPCYPDPCNLNEATGEVCDAGICNCGDAPCDVGQICNAGVCEVPDPCDPDPCNLNEANGDFCDAGICNCGDDPCDVGQICKAGICVVNPCAPEVYNNGTCVCVDTTNGHTDENGDGCDGWVYQNDADWSCNWGFARVGQFDTDQFTANTMCCACRKTKGVFADVRDNKVYFQVALEEGSSLVCEFWATNIFGVKKYYPFGYMMGSTSPAKYPTYYDGYAECGEWTAHYDNGHIEYVNPDTTIKLTTIKHGNGIPWPETTENDAIQKGPFPN